MKSFDLVLRVCAPLESRKKLWEILKVLVPFKGEFWLREETIVLNRADGKTSVRVINVLNHFSQP